MGSNLWRVEIDEDLCIGAGECVLIAPGAFALHEDDAVARVTPGASSTPPAVLSEAADMCPTGAIGVFGER